MPYYSELGIYTPSSSYTSPLIKGPYSNHSSIIASNILPLPKQIHRSNFRGFKPHLTTISEANATAPLRRISSPKVIYHSSPKVRVQRPIKINTADIDVSVNKYNNYVERGSAEKRSPTSRSEPPPVQPEKEAKPNTNIRRDRATIRLQTIHKDALEKEIGTIKSWRDKFKPEELVTEARVKRKSPGEKLKEKFLIKSKSKEKIPHTETPKLTRRPSVKKSASFKDICNVITSDRAIEDLNPGQPIDIRRRQSRQVSHEDIIKEIERTSSNLSQEEVELLDALIKAENEVGLYETPPIIDDKPKTRKKKVTRKKTVEGLIKKTDKSDLPSAETDGAVKKSVSEGNVLDGASSKLRKDSSLQNMVKDISQVEIEMIPVKQKPIITGSVGDIDENAKSKLKLVVEDYQVHESPTPPKKEKKFRFNVTVEEFPVKKKIHFPKQKLSDQDYGVMHLPQAKPLVLNNLMKKNISKHTGTVTEEPKIFKRKEPPVEEAKMKKKLLKSLSEIQVRNKNDNSLQKSGSNDSMCSNFTVLVNKSKSDEGFTAGDSRTSSGKLKIISIEKNLTDKNNAAASLIKTTRKDLKENTFLSKGDLGQKKPQPLWAQRNKAAKTINITSSVEEKLKISPKNNLEEKVIAPETQSPFSDKLPEALDENKITLELKKSEPLLAPENKKEENVHGSSKEDVVEVDLSKIASTEVETKEIQSPTTKTTCVEDTVTETLTLDVEKQASTVETKGTEIKEIQSPVSDKTTDGVLDENKQNKFLSKVDPQKKKPLWAQRNEAAKLLNKSKSLEDKVKETPILDVNKQAAAVEKKDDEIKEIQSPVSDKTTDGVLDENKQNKFLSKVDPQQKKPLWAQRNEAAKLLNKSKSLEDKVKETPILDVNKQAAAVEKKDDEIKEIQSPVSDKTTDGVLDENKQNKFLSKVDPQQKKPLWAQRNEAAKMLNKSKSLEDKVKETPILDVNKQAAAVEKKDDEIKEIQSPVSDKTTDGVLDENKQNKFLSKVDLGLNKSTLEDKIKETPKKAPAVDSLKTETKEVETKQIQSLDSDKLTEKVTPSVNNLIQNETIMIEPDAGDKVAEEAVTATATSNQSTLRQNSGPVEVKSSTEELKPPLESKQDEIKDLKNEKREELVPQKCEIETKKSKEPKQPPETADTQLDDFWTDTDSVPYEPPVLGRLTLDISEPEPESLEEVQQKMTSKRSLIQKANKDDPDLKIFEPPTPPPQEPVKEPSPEPSFVPLQSNRLSQWMHPWKKPEQKDDGQVELFAKPKFIRARHIPRRWQQNVNSESEDSTTTDDEDSSGEDSEEDEDGEEEAEEEEVEDEEDAGGENKIGASTSSTDSGFESGRTKNKECEVNCHKKCQKLMANLCGINQKLVVEAIEKVRKGSIDSRDSPGSTLNPASNPAFALDFNDLPEEVSQSSTYQSFQRSGRITPPATTIPRFRKYCVEDFNFLKVLGKGSFGKVLLAELKGTEYYYAVKCLKKDVVLEDDDVECTLIERKVLALGTKHPYLCHLLCTFQTESHLFFVMEYLNGGDLMFHIQMERRFSEARARFYGAEIVSGLRFLHNKGIVYRDLKLDNILLDFDGHVRIADFGMCKLQIFLDRMADTFCGTPDYMAPEIIKGQHYNQCVDWWSFGVLLYEMLLGQSPFSGCDEDELFWSICNEKPVIPRFLSAEATSVLTQFLEKDANKRLGNRFSPHGDIQDHPFFQPIDWPALEARKLEPPFKPNLQHPLDTQYFDKTFTTEKAKLTPIEGPILQSMDQTQFQGFSYTNPNATDK